MIGNNYLSIKNNYPDLLLQLNTFRTEDEDFIELELIDNCTDINAKVTINNKKIFLHSSYNHLNESERWSFNFGDDCNLFVIFGGGFYYHVEYLLKTYPEKKFLIVEPSIKIFNEVIQSKDISKIIDNENVLVIVSSNSSEIAMLMAQIMINKGIQKFEVHCLPSYSKLFEEVYNSIEKDIFNVVKTLRSNIGTEYVHSLKWLRNYFENIQMVNVESMPLSEFSNSFNGFPAIIVSAGPSLEKQIELLRQSLDKFVIFSAGSAINALEKNSIIPHFMVAVDAEEIQDNIFKNINTSETSLLYSNSIRYSALRMFKGKKFWFKGNADRITEYYEEKSGFETDSIEMGPSCANIAMDLAVKLNCNPIIFIGQDLAYTNKELYTKDVIHPINMDSDIGDRIIVTDMFGNKTTTKSNFLVMKSYFEDYVKAHKKNDFINCTEGGLCINGMKHQSFSETLKELSKIEKSVFDIIEEEFSRIKSVMENHDFKNINKAFYQSIFDELQKVNLLSEERNEIIKALLNDENLINLDQAEGVIDEIIDEVLRITEALEAFNIHKNVFYPLGAAFFLSVRQTVYNKITGVESKLEKQRVILSGLEKQYVYYHKLVTELMIFFNNSKFL